MRFQSSAALEGRPQIWNEPARNLCCYVTYRRSLHHLPEDICLTCALCTKKLTMPLNSNTITGEHLMRAEKTAFLATTCFPVCCSCNTTGQQYFIGCACLTLCCRCCEKYICAVQNMWRTTWENWAPGLDALASHFAAAAAVRKRKWWDWKSWEGGQQVDKRWGFRRWMETKEDRTELEVNEMKVGL